MNEIVKKESESILEQEGPGAIISGAGQVANLLKKIIEKQKLYVTIKGRKHVKIEGWTAMGAMLKVFPQMEKVERLDRGDEIAYMAVAKAVIEGQEIRGFALCSSKERNWKGKDEFAIMSMAQTRAVSKCLKLTLSWVMDLAGFDPTPAEEIMQDEQRGNGFPPKDGRSGRKVHPAKIPEKKPQTWEEEKIQEEQEQWAQEWKQKQK